MSRRWVRSTLPFAAARGAADDFDFLRPGLTNSAARLGSHLPHRKVSQRRSAQQTAYTWPQSASPVECSSFGVWIAFSSLHYRAPEIILAIHLHRDHANPQIHCAPQPLVIEAVLLRADCSLGPGSFGFLLD